MAGAHAQRITVVGASTLGCEFSIRAAEAGYAVTLVDEHPQSMAQMAFDAPYFYGAALPAALANENAIAQAVIEANPQIFTCLEAGIDVRVGTVAWGAFQNGPNSRHIGAAKVGLVTGKSNELLEHDVLVLATGMRDFVPSFRGSELPGVFGVKAGVAFLDQYQCYEGKRTLVLGTSSRAVDFVKRASARGVQIIGMVEPGQSFAAGEAQAAEIARLGVPVYLGQVILAAEGSIAVTGARLRSLSSSEEVMLDCDSICSAIAVLPNIELPAAMGCRMRFEASAGSWLPETDAAGRTSLERVVWLSQFSVANVDLALQGLSTGTSIKDMVPGSLQAGAQGGYLRCWIKALLETGGGTVTLCKCESITRDALLGLAPPAYLKRGLRPSHSPVTGSDRAPRLHQDLVKRMTRAGMGHCQGKRCRDEAAQLLSIEFGIGLEEISPGSYRFPIRPVDLSAIATEDDTYDTREKWSYWLHETELPSQE